MSGFTPTGTVTYTLYLGTTCSGTVVSSAQTETLVNGTAQSPTSGPLNPAAYSYRTTYTGDANYSPLTPGTCEPFTVFVGDASAPSVANLPTGAVFGGSFTATVATNGDGVKFVVSNSPAACTVGANGVTVSFVRSGSCSITADVAGGTNWGGEHREPSDVHHRTRGTFEPSGLEHSRGRDGVRQLHRRRGHER